MLAAVSSCKKTTTQLEDDTDAIKTYLATNGITAEELNKVFYQVISEGTGEQCAFGDTVAIKYHVSTTETPPTSLRKTRATRRWFTTCPIYSAALLPAA